MKSTVFLDIGKKNQKIRNKLSKFMNQWCLLLGLDRWEIIAEYCAESDTLEPGLNGCAKVQWPYKRAVIKFHISQLYDNDDVQLERLVVHELMHVVVNEMRGKKFDNDDLQHEERVVTELTDSFLRLQG